ncbi:armadillo repeat-containing protein 3 isoform X2 [Microcaecilia unicolor]|uniref:Armadillo repeat-containing protein 3 isoform X2 n=1 Tax=Microcaecilia unicolor TaxID=1415580 RepID=A0A6P7XI67_9AMPH|nr:armadillo repeat-containing protein 3 isoform X2 [Microcaecilia unicolor]
MGTGTKTGNRRKKSGGLLVCNSRMGKKIKKDSDLLTRDFEPLLIESRNAATVVLMLSSPEEEILTRACDAIYRFADKGDVRKLLRKLNVVPAIIDRLEPEEDTVIHEYATLFLSSMAIEYTSKIQIFENGGIEPLVRLLNNSDPDVQKNCVESINLLVQDFRSRAAVCELNGIPPLLELLKSEYPVIQLLGLKTFATLTKNADCRVKLRDYQLLDFLMEILETKELNDLHIDALSVVMNCLEDEDTVQQLGETGNLEKLLSFAEFSPVPEIQKIAAKAIAKAAQNSENRKILHEKEVERVLGSLLLGDNSGVKIAACQAVSVMCATFTSKEAFRKPVIPRIVPLLSSEDGEVKEAATFALTKLTTESPRNVNAVAEAEGIEPLIRLLSDQRDGAVANAATVLINMASQEVLRLSMQTLGIMPAIVGPLQSTNDLVQSKAALTVAAVACDINARNELRNAGGLGPLVKLLNSMNDEIRRNACWAVMVCANDESNASELSTLGALDILQEINQSRSRKNYFSEAAMNKLLDSNLSLKYSLVGYLLSCNIIYDGFYDCGKKRPGEKHLSLKELLEQEINHHRAVLLINAKPLEQVPTVMFTVEERPDTSGRSTSAVSKSSYKDKASTAVSSPAEEKQEPSSRRSPASPPKGTAKEKSSSKVKWKSKKEEEKAKEEEEQMTKMQTEVFIEKEVWSPPSDSALQDYVVIVTTNILPLHHIKDQVVTLAQFVAEQMGGPIEQDKLQDFSWEIHISELKLELQSNVIPIGKIKKGIFFHRALLFKALADRIGISCSLVRGHYNRSWNIVKLVDDSPNEVTGLLLPPKAYVVDLMFKPGRLMEQHSVDADRYQHI